MRFWRCNNGKKVWYEWAVTEPSCSAIHNPAGRSYTIGLWRRRVGTSRQTSCVSVRLGGSGRTGVVTLFTQLKTWTCVSTWKSAVVGTLQFRKNGSDKPNLNLSLFKSRATFTMPPEHSVLLLWDCLIQIRSNVNTASSCYPFLLVLIVLNHSSTQRFILNPTGLPYQTHIPYTIFAYLNPSPRHEKIRRRNCFSGCIPWDLRLFVHTFVLFEPIKTTL